MKEWFRARSPGRAATPIAAVLAGVGVATLVMREWPNLAEVVGHMTIGLFGSFVFYWVLTWAFLHILALFVGKWWEKDES